MPGFEDINAIEAIIQGGSVGVAVLALFILWRALSLGAKLLNNHLTHITEGLGRIAEKLDRLIALNEWRRGE